MAKTRPPSTQSSSGSGKSRSTSQSSRGRSSSSTQTPSRTVLSHVNVKTGWTSPANPDKKTAEESPPVVLPSDVLEASASDGSTLEETVAETDSAGISTSASATSNSSLVEGLETEGALLTIVQLASATTDSGLTEDLSSPVEFYQPFA